MWRSFDYKEDSGDDRQARTKEEGIFESAPLLGYMSADEQAYPDTHVPAGEVGRCRRTALPVLRQINEQCIECREHRPEGYALRQRYQYI